MSTILRWIFLPVRVYGTYKLALFIAAGGLGVALGTVLAHIRDASWIDTAALVVSGATISMLAVALSLAYWQHKSGLCSPVTLVWYWLPFRRVSWDFAHYLTGPGDRISKFGPRFKVNWPCDRITVSDAYIECKRTDTRIPVEIERGNPYMKPDNTFYPRGKIYHCQALFYDPQRKCQVN